MNSFIINFSANFSNDFQLWIYSFLSATLIGIAGIFPLIFIPVDYVGKINSTSFNALQIVLSFAVGGLLSDVFLHLLPEAWTLAIEDGSSPLEAVLNVGLYVLCGIFIFVIVEMFASVNNQTPCENNNIKKTKDSHHKNKVVGYLNLIANGIDNFAHGLAVAGSFLVSIKMGILTTSAILIHEIPHEIGDFAILLNSGFSRWEATKAQLYTASFGLLGAFITLILGTSNCLGGIHVYILGFTAGAFLNIALVTVLPDLLQEKRPKQSFVQLLSLLFGSFIMATVALFC